MRLFPLGPATEAACGNISTPLPPLEEGPGGLVRLRLVIGEMIDEAATDAELAGLASIAGELAIGPGLRVKPKLASLRAPTGVPALAAMTSSPSRADTGGRICEEEDLSRGILAAALLPIIV